MTWWVRKYDSPHDKDDKVDGGLIGYTGSTEPAERAIERAWTWMGERIRALMAKLK
ncbi:MAG: hypothetical protein ACWGQW_12300 [bacterium]